ncbi:MAG: ATP-binding cassette domain-containing protein [Beijerinckiaceae bacterium]|nr:ATP-binding cassette domain-containing protein [Beijerinckiaceae bacterium]
MTMHPFQRLLAFAVAAMSVLAIALNLAGLVGQVPLYVSVAGLVLAGGMLATPGIGAYLRFFIVFYGLGYLALMAVVILGGLTGLAWLKLVPPLTAFTAAAFGLLAILLARLPITRRVFAIADPYFETPDRGTLSLWPIPKVNAPERWIAFVLLGVIIVINLAQVGITVRLNQWNREFYDAIQNKNQPEFWRQLLEVWMPIVAVFILSNIIELVLVSVFKIRWREWMTNRLSGRWLDNSTHYTLQFGHAIDNPDQRIQEDVRKYTETTYTLTIQMIAQISSLVSFSVILWNLSANLPIPGTETKLPGMLFWIALVYAGIGTILAHFIGRRLIRLNFEQEKYEADFRYLLARLREFNEPIALLRGEPTEKKRLGGRFRSVAKNYMEIIGVAKWLNAFTSFYGMANSVIPIVILAPFYFLDKITLGVMFQTASAFGRVDAALSFFIDRYSTIADYKAVVDRLTGFEQSIDSARQTQKATAIRPARAISPDLVIPELELALPDGRTIARIRDLTFRRGQRTLLVGPSGSGKSTLFRAISGIWPFGSGTIDIPAGASVMLLPQRPYIPMGTLRGAVSYPAVEGAHDDAAIVAALEAVRLPALVTRLDEEANWSQVLSGGEQQRLAVARALLARPDWLLLDESTSALDEPLEDAIYAAITRLLPETSVISIGHRSSLIDNHDRRVEMRMGPDSLYSIEEARQPA